ncbi:MAG: benzoylformate decarboxylase [Acetobacteraceae bacterium]|nr:benzoylformate decarboxylase [Acetobacteraceae bacterium]
MTTVFGNPGSTELPFLGDWPNDLRYVLGLQEASVVAMADGYARASGRAAFCNLHSAAGVGHALGNIFTAHRNNAPLVITAGQQARSLLANQPFLGATEAANFPKPYVKWSAEPARAEDVPAAIAQAYRIAMTRPRGPCFVSVPVDDWAVACAALPHRGLSADTAPDPVALELLAKALEGAQRPVLVAGPEVDEEGAGPDLVALAEKLRAPVWTSPFASRLCFPEDHPLFAGHLVAAPEAVARSLAGHDLMLVVGAPVFTFHVVGHCALFDGSVPLWHLTTDGEAAARAPAGESILGALRFALPAVTALLPKPRRKAPPARPRPAPPAASDPMPGGFVLSRLAAAMPRGAILVEEAPSHRPAMHAQLPMRDWGGFFTMASGGLGYSLPAAVGIALAKPGRRVVCLIGDGSLMYSVQALWTAAQLGLPLTVIVLNNQGYGAMRAFSRVMGTRGAPGIDIGGLDVPALAAGHGVPGERVERAAELDAALARAFAAPGPVLLDVAVELTAAKLYDEKKE